MTAVAIIKHANASGAALGTSLGDAFDKALRADPQSAFGGIIAIDGQCDASTRRADRRRGLRPTSSSPHPLPTRRSRSSSHAARPRGCSVRPSPEPLGLSVRTFGDTALVQNADELLCR